MASPSLVVGVDFSQGSRKALRGAALFAARAGMRVVLVHAFPKAPARLAGAPRRRVAAAVGTAEVDEASTLSLKWAEALRRDGLVVEVVAREGKPAEVLLAEARRQRAALIVLGTTGKGLLARAFLGSTARKVAEQASVPVLLFPQRGRTPRGAPGPVVAGVDLGVGSRRVLDAAAALARDLGAPLQAVHALHIPLPIGDFQGVAGVYTPMALEEDERAAAAELTALTEPLRNEASLRNFVEVGDAPTALATHARRVRAACLVVGRRRTRKAGFGSVSAALVARADRPVLVVPAAAR